jgi:hypothetical protein
MDSSVSPTHGEVWNGHHSEIKMNAEGLAAGAGELKRKSLPG